MATAERDSKGRFKSTDEKSNGNRHFGALAGAAAGGAALGLLAMFGRKAMVQAPSMMAGSWDEALALEHQAVLKLFDAMAETDSRNTTKRSMLLMQMKHALAKHAIEEENVIYPALRDAGKVEQADALNRDHGYVKQYLYDLENMPNDSPEFLTKLAKFRAEIEAHMRKEEDELFPELKAQLSEEKNSHLTLVMNKEGFKVA